MIKLSKCGFFELPKYLYAHAYIRIFENSFWGANGISFAEYIKNVIRLFVLMLSAGRMSNINMFAMYRYDFWVGFESFALSHVPVFVLNLFLFPSFSGWALTILFLLSFACAFHFSLFSIEKLKLSQNATIIAIKNHPDFVYFHFINCQYVLLFME